MKPFHPPRRLPILVMVFLLLFLCVPSPSIALRPLDDNDLIENSPELVEKKNIPASDSNLTPFNETQLEELSPSLTVPPKDDAVPPSLVSPAAMDQPFQNSICFKRCHQARDFNPEDRTARQWQLLIQENGHFLFEEIPWQSVQEKEEILQYLLQHSKKTRPGPAGIGVW